MSFSFRTDNYTDKFNKTLNNDDDNFFHSSFKNKP